MAIGTSARSWLQSMIRWVRVLPLDMVGVLCFLALVHVVSLTPGIEGATIAGASIRAILGIPFLLLVPGYVLVAILSPARRRDGQRRRASANRRQGIDWPERMALSFGASVALVPIFAVVVGSGWSFSTGVVLASIEIFVLVGVVLASVRRLRLPPEHRYQFPLRRHIAYLRRGSFSSDNTFDRVLTVALVVGILAAFGSVGYALATPYESNQSSTLYLVTENETGSLVASDYPSELTAGEGEELIVGVQNNEERQQSYTVVIVTERVRTNGTVTTVTEAAEIDRLHATVPDGSDWTETHDVVPEMVGDDIRLHYYLYRGDTAPSNPDSDSAYRDTYIWINVSEAT